MAKETPAVQNSKMLVISLGLALLVVVLYNVQVNRIRTEAQGTKTLLLKYKMNKSAGDTISDTEDLQAVEVDSKLAKDLTSVITDEDRDKAIKKKLVHGVAANSWVLLDDFADRSDFFSPIPKGEGLISIPIDPMYSPGRLLKLGACVNVLGEVQIKPGQFKIVRLIDGLVVKSIGGRSRDDVSRPGEDISNSYREIGSSLPRQPKDMVTQWYNVLSYVKGGRAILELRNPADPLPSQLEFGPEVKDKVDKADPTHGNVNPSGGGGSLPAPL